MSDAERAARAMARQQRAILRKGRLTREEFDLSPIQGAAAVSLVAQLTEESFELAGYAGPTYTRSTIPVRFVPGRLT